jgi:hypothetical protein
MQSDPLVDQGLQRGEDRTDGCRIRSSPKVPIREFRRPDQVRRIPRPELLNEIVAKVFVPISGSTAAAQARSLNDAFATCRNEMPRPFFDLLVTLDPENLLRLRSQCDWFCRSATMLRVTRLLVRNLDRQASRRAARDPMDGI